MKVKTTAENRKDVVKAMEEILNVKAKYQGPPSFGYKVGEYTVDRDGNVEHESEEAALTMQNELVARGLAEGETDRLNIGIPIEGFTAEGIKNLIYMIHSKQYLLEKAVGKKVFRISDKLVERLDAEENISLEKVIQIAEEESIEGLFVPWKCWMMMENLRGKLIFLPCAPCVERRESSMRKPFRKLWLCRCLKKRVWISPI